MAIGFWFNRCVILSFVFTSTRIDATAADRDKEVYVSDRYGNKIFKNGTVRFVSPIPVGDDTYSTKLDYDAKGLDTLYDFARSFVEDIMPLDFPFDLLDEIVNGNFSISEDYKQIVEQVQGLAVCIVVGVVFIVAFVIGGFSFCCCRFLCGNCGGDGVQQQKKNEPCMRMGLTQALFLMLISVFASTVCLYTINDTFTDAIHFTNESVVSNIGDVARYLNNTGRRFQYLVSDMFDLPHEAIMKDLTNLGDLVEEDIFATLKVDKAIDDITGLDESLRQLSMRLNHTMTDISAVKRAASDFSNDLNSLATDIDSTVNSVCPTSTCTPSQICAGLDTSALRNSTIDVSALPDLSGNSREIESIRTGNNFTALVQNVHTDLDKISTTITRETTSIRTAVNSSLMSYYYLIHGLSDGVFKTMTEAFPVARFSQRATNITDTVLFYDRYRRYFGLVLTSVLLALILLYSTGMVLGIAYYDSKALPTERSGGSNLGGNILLFAVALTFLVGALFMILTIFAFLFGALLEKGCEPVEDLGYFKEFLDKGKLPGYSLSGIALGVEDLKLSTYDVLLGCRADLTPWKVLHMNEAVPLEKYLNFINYVGDIGEKLAQLQDLDLKMFSFVTNDLDKSLRVLDGIEPDDFNFTSINSVLQEPVSVDFKVFLDEMKSIQDACQDPAKPEWSRHIFNLESIQTAGVTAVEEAKSKLQASSSELESSIIVFSESIKTVRNNSAYIDAQIQRDMSSILLQSSVGLVGRLFSYLRSYADEVYFVINNSLGNCRPLWNIYKSASIVLCDYCVNELNGYWFTIGWSLFFFPSMVVVAALLANHYKRMDAAVKNQEFSDFIGHSGDLPESSVPPAMISHSTSTSWRSSFRNSPRKGAAHTDSSEKWEST